MWKSLVSRVSGRGRHGSDCLHAHAAVCTHFLSTTISSSSSAPSPSSLSKAAIVSHPSCLFHEIKDHPESPERLRAIMECLKNPELSEHLKFIDDPKQISRSTICMAHSQKHVEDIFDKAEDAAEHNKVIHLDLDTAITPTSSQSIISAAACVCHAVDLVLDHRDQDQDEKTTPFWDASPQKIARAFCAVRPPGHHAEFDKSMGFCIFNNVFIGAKYAREWMADRRDIHTSKIAIVDFDVHHGNGTQALVWNEAHMFYASLHQYSADGTFYPGTGGIDECGGFDNVLNVPLKAGADGADVKRAFNDRILPRLHAFAPDLLMISAGFDAHCDDPLAELSYHENDYAWMTEQLVAVANEHCHGKIVSVLEGGYNCEALKKCVYAHVKALCG